MTQLHIIQGLQSSEPKSDSSFQYHRKQMLSVGEVPTDFLIATNTLEFIFHPDSEPILAFATMMCYCGGDSAHQNIHQSQRATKCDAPVAVPQ